MDPGQGAEMRQLIRTLGTDHAVFVSSHVLADVETLCDRVVVLHHGRVLAEGTPLHLAARLRTSTSVDVEAGAPEDELEHALATVPGVRRIERLAASDGRVRCRVEADPGVDLRPAIAADVGAHGWALYALAPVEPSLEEAFLALVRAPVDPA